MSLAALCKAASKFKGGLIKPKILPDGEGYQGRVKNTNAKPCRLAHVILPLASAAGFEPTSPRPKRGILPLNDAPKKNDGGRCATSSYALLPLGGVRWPLATQAAAVAIVVALGACASNQLPPQDNGFCSLYQALPDPSDAVNMKKRENKLAVLANEETNIRECSGLGNRDHSLGPR